MEALARTLGGRHPYAPKWRHEGTHPPIGRSSWEYLQQFAHRRAGSLSLTHNINARRTNELRMLLRGTCCASQPNTIILIPLLFKECVPSHANFRAYFLILSQLCTNRQKKMSLPSPIFHKSAGHPSLSFNASANIRICRILFSICTLARLHLSRRGKSLSGMAMENWKAQLQDSRFVLLGP